MARQLGPSNEGQAVIAMSFEVDQEALEKSKQAMNDMAKDVRAWGEAVDEETERSEGAFSKLGAGVSSLGGVFAGVLAGLSTLGISKLTKDTAELESQIQRLEGTVGKGSERIAKNLSRMLDIPIVEIRDLLNDFVAEFEHIGFTKAEGVDMARRIMIRARKVGGKTKTPFVEVLDAFKSLMFQGSAEELTKIMGIPGREHQAIVEMLKQTVLKAGTEIERVQSMAQFGLDITQPAAGYKRDSIKANQDRIDTNLENAADTMRKTLIGPIKDLSGKVADLTQKIEPLAEDIANKIGVLIKNPALGVGLIGVFATLLQFVPWGRALKMLAPLLAATGVGKYAWEKKEDMQEFFKEKYKDFRAWQKKHGAKLSPEELERMKKSEAGTFLFTRPGVKKDFVEPLKSALSPLKKIVGGWAQKAVKGGERIGKKILETMEKTAKTKDPLLFSLEVLPEADFKGAIPALPPPAAGPPPGMEKSGASQKGAAASVTNNFKISVMSSHADPLAVAKKVEQAFDRKFREHLGTQTSGVIA